MSVFRTGKLKGNEYKLRILKYLNDQVLLAFTGRVNILIPGSNQFIGVVFLEDGEIVGAEHSKLKGTNALFELYLIEILNTHQFKFVIEPEIIGIDQTHFRMSPNKSFAEFKKYNKSEYRLSKLRPENSLKICVNEKFIESGEELSSAEFKMLEIIAVSKTIGDVFFNSNFNDFLTNSLLVLLRQKKAIKVLK